MTPRMRVFLSVFSFCLAVSLFASGQDAKPGILSAAELKQVVSSAYFFRGQSAMV